MDLYQLTSPLVLPMLIVWLIQLVKKSRLGMFAWVSEHTPLVSRALSLALSALAAAHITWVWNPDIGQLTIKGLMWTTITTGLYTWLGTFSVSEVVYTIVQIRQQLGQLAPVPLPAKPGAASAGKPANTVGEAGESPLR